MPIPSNRSPRGARRARSRGVAFALAGASALALTAASTASAVPASSAGYILQIQDHIPLPGQTKADSVLTGTYSETFPPPNFGDVFPALRIFRGGQEITNAGRAQNAVWVDDLRDGDEIRIVDGGWNKHDALLASVLYHGGPTLDQPVCAGRTTVTGLRGAESSFDDYYGQAVLWEPSTTPYPGSPGESSGSDYPGEGPYVPYASYPGYAPGWQAALPLNLIGAATSPDRFSATASGPLVAGMHVYVRGQFQPLSNVAMSVETDQIVTACPTPTPSPTQVPQAQPTSTPKPAGDRTPPKGTLTSTTSKALRKLGRRKLLRGGLPVTITSDEPARLVGTLTLLGGRKPFASTVSINVIKGVSITHVPISAAMLKQIKKAKHPRLRLEGALVDGAGNRLPLPSIAVTVPRR